MNKSNRMATVEILQHGFMAWIAEVVGSVSTPCRQRNGFQNAGTLREALHHQRLGWWMPW